MKLISNNRNELTAKARSLESAIEIIFENSTGTAEDEERLDVLYYELALIEERLDVLDTSYATEVLDDSFDENDYSDYAEIENVAIKRNN